MADAKKTTKIGYDWMGALSLVTIIAVGIVVGKLVNDKVMSRMDGMSI